LSAAPPPSPGEVREFVLGRLESHLATRGFEAAAVPDDFDLLTEGVIDSFGIVELVMQLEQRYGFEIDFSALDADDLTRIGPLSRHVSQQGGFANVS
jgi:acyl carrier protein